MKKNRKAVSLLLTAALVIALCSCGGNSSSAPAAEPAPVAESEELNAADKEAAENAEAAHEEPGQDHEAQADAQPAADTAQIGQPTQAEEIAEKYPAADLPVEGMYTLFAVRNQGYSVRSEEMAADSTITLKEGGTGSMSIGDQSMEISDWSLEDGTVTITMDDGSSASGELRGGIIELKAYGDDGPLLVYAQEAADTSGYELLTPEEVEERKAAEEEAARTRIGTVLAETDLENGVHLRYQLRLDELNTVQEFDVHAKGGKYYSMRTTKVGAVEETVVTFIGDGKVYSLYPDKKTGTYVTDLPLSLAGQDTLLMDSLYSEMRTASLRKDGAEEEREAEGVSYSADVYPRTDHQAETAFLFAGDGQLAFCIKGAPVVEAAPAIGESFYTVEAIDSEVDESLFDISAYTID